jgi:hypothetical protein
MNKFIVVEIHQPDREHVEDVEFIKSFESDQDAQKFIDVERSISFERAKERHEYIKEFAKTLPDEYRYSGFKVRENTQREILSKIEYNKKTGKDIELLKDYNPPEFIPLRDLRIVEIK